MFKKKKVQYTCYKSYDNVIKYHGSVFPQDWDMSFEKKMECDQLL